MVVAGLQGEGNRKLLINGYRVSDEEDKILEMDGGDNHTMWMYGWVISLASKGSLDTFPNLIPVGRF